jgi:penicillin-binding protein 2
MLIFDQLTKKDPQLRVLALVVLGGMGVLLAGLWYVQVISSNQYSENQKAQSFRTVRIPAIRGKILDQHGYALAENAPNYQASLYLEELRQLFTQEWQRSQPPLQVTHYQLQLFGYKLFEWERTRPAYKAKLTRAQRQAFTAEVRWRVVSNVLQQLSARLQQPVTLDKAQFIHHYTNQLALPLPLLTNLNPSQIALFQEMPNNIPGLDLEIQPTRVYPLRTTGAHLVGFLKRDDSSMEDEDAFFNYRLPDYRGLLGIEGAYDQALRGKAGVKCVLVNNLGYRQSETIWTPAEPGDNVVLTIDLRIQQAAEQALQAATSKHHPLRGAVVVMDPNNGDILALVSLPSFDPNLFIPKISAEEFNRLMDENTKPQRNRASQENYHPGSVFKLIVSLACLEAGLNPAEKITVPPDPRNPAHGYIQVGKQHFGDLAPPDEYDFYRAFIKSSNTYFITNGLRVGPEALSRMAQQLHLGERTGLPTFQDTAGHIPSLARVRRNWSNGDTANMSIGQGEVDVTPLQVAVVVSAIANGGKVWWPRLVSRTEPQNPTSGEPQVFKPGHLRDQLRVSPRSLQLVREAMYGDVQDPLGSGRGGRLDGFPICAKTGTAQVMDLNNVTVDHITWFASYAPFDHPRYVVVVMVEGGDFGGTTCAPVARTIYKAIQGLDNQRTIRATRLAQAN